MAQDIKTKLTYKGHTGSINWSEEDHCFYGKIEGIRDLVSYEGNSLKSLEEDFKASVNDYLELLEQRI